MKIQINMEKLKYKIGDKVKISEDSEYLEQAVINGGRLVGKVTKINHGCGVEHYYDVTWSNKYRNTYRELDLEPFPLVSIKTIEIY